MPTIKDRLELNYWLTADMKEHRAKLLQYVGAWSLGAGWPKEFGTVLEIGTGPTGGILPLINAKRKIGVDPMHQIYCDLELLTPDKSVEYNAEYFEAMSFNGQRFDAIFCADALDHGDLSFSIIPRIADLLSAGGRFYLHVHLRPPDLINLIHDHGLTIEQLDKVLTNDCLTLEEQFRKVYPTDVDEKFCEAVVGVWESL